MNRWIICLQVFLKPNMHQQFERYEKQVIPLLATYGGKLEAVIRPNQSAATVPDEIHFVSFPTQADFERYKVDPKREKFSQLFQESVAQVVMLEGENLTQHYL